MSCQSRCTGHCCRIFPLPLSPIELQQEYRKAIHKEGRYNYQELCKIANMAVHLKTTHIDLEGNYQQKPSHYYTCKHFDGKNCTIYNDRPNMCKDYPYGQPCKIKGCTQKD